MFVFAPGPAGSIAFEHFLPAHLLFPVCLCCWMGGNMFPASRRGAGMQQRCTATLRGAGLVAEPGGERLLVYKHGWHQFCQPSVPLGGIAWVTMPTLHMMGALGTLTQGLPPASHPARSQVTAFGCQHPWASPWLHAALCLPAPAHPIAPPPFPLVSPGSPASLEGLAVPYVILYHFSEGAHCPV